MTLTVTKLIDDMVDLQTGQHHSHGIVVSNGVREQFVPLGREALQDLIVLYVDGVKAEEPQAAPQKANGRTAMPETSGGGQVAQPKSVQKPRVIDQKNSVTFTPNVEEGDAEEPDVGEEYADETGTPSF